MPIILFLDKTQNQNSLTPSSLLPSYFFLHSSLTSEQKDHLCVACRSPCKKLVAATTQLPNYVPEKVF